MNYFAVEIETPEGWALDHYVEVDDEDLYLFVDSNHKGERIRRVVEPPEGAKVYVTFPLLFKTED
jgi:hypothetical protein